MVNAALIAGTCIGVFIGVLLSVLLVIIALCYFGICKWPEDSESDNERERDTRNAREYKGIPLHSCVPRLSAEELEMRNKAIAKYKRRKAREERREARQRRREERQARAALLIALAKEKLDNEMMQNSKHVDRKTPIQCNNIETVATTESVLKNKVGTLTSKLNVIKTENNIVKRSENDNGTNVPIMSREELEALTIEQAHRTFSTNTTAADNSNNTVNNTQTNYANEIDNINNSACLDRRPSLSSSISASTLTTSVSTSVLTSSAIAYGRGAYLPHDELYENSVLTVNTATMNKININNNNNQHENGGGDEKEEEEEYWPRGMGSASNVQEEDLHHIDIPYYYELSEEEENNYNNENNDDNIEMQSRRSSASRGTLATIKSYVKQLGSRVRARQRRNARRQWQSENDHDLNSEDVDIFNQWETSLPSSSSSSESSSSTSESESESEFPTNESLLAHDVNASNQEKLSSDVHDITSGIHNTISNTNNINHSITPTSTITTINVEQSENRENNQAKEKNEAKNSKRRNTKANKEQRHHHRHHKRRNNNRNITNEDEDVNNDNDDDTHSVASSAPRPPDEILKNYHFLCMNSNKQNSNINKEKNKVTHTTKDDTEKGTYNNNIANDHTHNNNKSSNAIDFLSECQDNSTKHLGHDKEMQTAELPGTHEISNVDANTCLHEETAAELQEQNHHQIDEASTEEKQALSLSVQSVNNNHSTTLRTPPEHEPTFNTSQHTSSSSSLESELELTPEQSHKQTLHKSQTATKQLQNHSHHHHHHDQEEKSRSQSQTHHSTTVKDYQRKKWTGRDVEHNVAMSGFFTTPLQQRDMMYYSNNYNTNNNMGNNNINNTNSHHVTASDWRAETLKDAHFDNMNSKENNYSSLSSSVIVNNNNEKHDGTHISRSEGNDTESSGDNDDDTKNKADGYTYDKS